MKPLSRLVEDAERERRRAGKKDPIAPLGGRAYMDACSDAADITSQFADMEIPLICNELGDRYDLSYECCFLRIAAAVTQEVADILLETGRYVEPQLDGQVTIDDMLGGGDLDCSTT